MTSNETMLHVDMSLMFIEINSVVTKHVRKAVMNFNVSKIQEDIVGCSDKIHQLEKELTDLTGQEGMERTRLQETTYRINISLLDQEIISHRKKLQGMQEELSQIQSSVSDIETTCDIPDASPNIMLNIQEMEPKLVNDISSKVVTPLKVPDETPTRIINTDDTVSTTHNMIRHEVVGGDDISEIIPTEEEEEEEQEEEEEEEEGVFEIEVDGVSYYTTSEENGSLYSIDVNGDPDVYVGRLHDGKAVLV